MLDVLRLFDLHIMLLAMSIVTDLLAAVLDRGDVLGSRLGDRARFLDLNTSGHRRQFSGNLGIGLRIDFGVGLGVSLGVGLGLNLGSRSLRRGLLQNALGESGAGDQARRKNG